MVRRDLSVVITGRDPERTARIATEIGPGVTGVALDLAAPETIAAALAGIERVDQLVVAAAIERDANGVKDYDVAGATRLAVLKGFVGYTEVVHALHERLARSLGGAVRRARDDASLPGVDHRHVRQWRDQLDGPDPGLRARARAGERTAPRHRRRQPRMGRQEPRDGRGERTPIGRTVRMAEIVGATFFLLDNGGVNGVNLMVDGGTLVR